MSSAALRLFSVLVVACNWCTTSVVYSYQYGDDDAVDLVKKSQCVELSGPCFNSQQCCSGSTCALVDSDMADSPETPGRCVRNKDLKPCTSAADCDPQAVCAAPRQSNGQRYCLSGQPASGQRTLLANRLQSAAATTGAGGPRKHQAYSRKLSPLGGPCDSDDDCQTYSVYNPTTRLCCQQVRRGRQGVRRICDRVTPISICTPN